jgi:DNA invertase Pin-like site-specific DNA recombinase
MGRLTLNVLLSFAQFDREVTGERIRDKIAEPANNPGTERKPPESRARIERLDPRRRQCGALPAWLPFG